MVEIINHRFEWPTLVFKNKLGKLIYWKIFVELLKKDSIDEPIKITKNTNIDKYKDNAARFYSIFGQNIEDPTYSEFTIIKEGKNIGKKNETTALEQCLKEAQSLYIKREKKYRMCDLTKNLLKPMLAQNFEKKRIDTITVGESYFVQAKLDGVRCLYNTEKNILYSRELKIFDNDLHKDIIKELKNLYHKLINIDTRYIDIIFDGEFYIHNIPLQKINSLTQTKDDNIHLEYHIFDIIYPKDLSIVFKDRFYNLLEILQDSEYVKIVKTEEIINDSNIFNNIKKIAKKYIQELNYEGIMIRKNTPYEISRRTFALLKYKEKLEESYIIIDYQIAKRGKFSGVPYFILSTELTNYKIRADERVIYNPTKSFKCMIKDMTLDELKKLGEKFTSTDLFKKKYYLFPAVVEYLSLSVDLKPKHAFITAILN